MNEKESLRQALYDRDGKKCHYCGIPEDNFRSVWGTFYGTGRRGTRLEIDRKDCNGPYETDNYVLACALCNMAKTDKFTHEEFLKIGKVINRIWRNRESPKGMRKS